MDKITPPEAPVCKLQMQPEHQRFQKQTPGPQMLVTIACNLFSSIDTSEAPVDKDPVAIMDMSK